MLKIKESLYIDPEYIEYVAVDERVIEIGFVSGRSIRYARTENDDKLKAGELKKLEFDECSKIVKTLLK